jgi:signal transduction histidine kinase
MPSGILKRGDRILLKGYKEANSVVIEVSDNGPGIPGNVIQKIFEPFFTTKGFGKGTGLGLSICYNIVRAHGGDISVKSKEGEGTVFVIELPY